MDDRRSSLVGDARRATVDASRRRCCCGRIKSSIHENSLYCQGGLPTSISVSFATGRETALPRAANVHQPSIRARTAAHDVSIRSSTTDAANRRGWAAHSMSRPWRAIDYFGHARTGTSAWGKRRSIQRASHDSRRTVKWTGRMAATPKLGIVDLIAEHDVETYKKFTCERDPCFGAPAAMQNREVAAPEIVVSAGGERRCLAKHPAKKRAALLSDFPEPLFIGGGIDGRGQADVTHDVLAVGEASNWSEYQNRRQRCQWADAGMGEQELGSGGHCWQSPRSVHRAGRCGRSTMRGARGRPPAGAQCAREAGAPAVGRGHAASKASTAASNAG